MEQRARQTYADGRIDEATLEEILASSEEDYIQPAESTGNKKKPAAPAASNEETTDNGVENSYSTVEKSMETEDRYRGRDLANDGEVYTYSFLSNLPDMQAVQLPAVADILDDNQNVDKAKVLKMGIENARTIGELLPVKWTVK